MLFVHCQTAKEIKEITSGNTTRKYLLHIPANYNSKEKVPLILVLHGGGGNGRNAEKMTWFSQKADKENFIVAYPYGTNKLFSEKLLTWNAGNCCGHALDKNVDDIEYIKQLILSIKNQYSIDANKVFVTGMSNGGMMSYRIGCELSEYVTGIAPVSGAMNVTTCKPQKSISVIIIHGKNDQQVLYEGGSPKTKVDRHERTDKSVKFAEEFWRNENGCTNRKVTKTGKVERVTYRCKRAKLSVISIDDEGHTWPGGNKGFFGADTPTKEISATEEIYQFFLYE